MKGFTVQFTLNLNSDLLFPNSKSVRQVSPLTALKFAELTLLAGFPPGVINVLPGNGSVTGQAIADHPLVRYFFVRSQYNLKRCLHDRSKIMIGPRYPGGFNLSLIQISLQSSLIKLLDCLDLKVSQAQRLSHWFILTKIHHACFQRKF